MNISPTERQNFYRAGALGLRALQDHGLGARRFTPNGDARWKAFRGELTDADQLDLLLRDGSVLHPLAFAAAAVFGLPDLAADEPFGPEWPGLPPSEAGPILREASKDRPLPEDARSASLQAIAAVWELKLPSVDVSHVGPASRVVLAGAGAIAALADHMAGRSDMDFGDQLLLVTDRPAERQLFGFAAALSASRTRPRTVRSDDSLDAIKSLRFDRCTAVVISDDADPIAQAAAKRISETLAG